MAPRATCQVDKAVSLCQEDLSSLESGEISAAEDSEFALEVDMGPSWEPPALLIAALHKANTELANQRHVHWVGLSKRRKNNVWQLQEDEEDALMQRIIETVQERTGEEVVRVHNGEQHVHTAHMLSLLNHVPRELRALICSQWDLAAEPPSCRLRNIASFVVQLLVTAD